MRSSSLTLPQSPEHAMQSMNSPIASAVLLTGGQGSRLGGCAKSLLRLDGKPLVLRQLEALYEAGVRQIVVVTGFYHVEVEQLLNASKESAPWAECVSTVRNPTPEDGQQSSVLQGLQALTPPFDLTLIVLVDQPLMTAKDYRECIDAHAARPSGTLIAYPSVDGKRGNPVALARQAVDAVLASGDTCRSYIERNKVLVHQYPSQNAHFLTDIDTLSDIENLRVLAGVNLQLP